MFRYSVIRPTIARCFHKMQQGPCPESHNILKVKSILHKQKRQLEKLSFCFLGCAVGLEPTTTRTTIWRSTN